MLGRSEPKRQYDVDRRNPPRSDQTGESFLLSRAERKFSKESVQTTLERFASLQAPCNSQLLEATAPRGTSRVREERGTEGGREGGREGEIGRASCRERV